MRAQLLAFAAASAGVFAAWEALGLADAVTVRATALVAPLRSGREPERSERRRLTAVASLTAFASGWILLGPLAAVVVAAATPLAVRRGLAAHAARRRAALVEAAPALARAIADALTGGSSIRAAVSGAHEGLSGVAHRELALLHGALEMGEEIDVALERLRSAAAHHAFDAIVAAVTLQREAGGDLAGLLRRLAATIEDDARADADARAATAQSRYSAALVACLPAVAAALVELAAPGSVRAMLSTPLSALLVAIAIGLQMLAWIVIRRVAAVAP